MRRRKSCALDLAPPAAVDARADVWSLAVTLHVLVSGKHPFDGSSAAEIRAAIATGVREKLRTFAPDVPQGLDLVLDRALSPAPEDRTASIAEFAQALGPFVSGRSPSNSAASRDEVHAPDVEAPSVETPSVEAPSVDTEGPAPTAPAQSAPAQAAPRAVSSPAEPVLRSEPAPKPESDAGAPSEPEPSPPISSPPAHPDATAPGATTMLPPPIAMTLLPPRGFPRKPLWAAFAVVGVLVLGGLASLLFRAPPSSDADAIHEATPEAPIAPAPRESIAPSEAPATASPEPEPEPSAAPDAQDASPSSPHHARRR